MASFNRVILIGNLCREPEFKRTQSGLSVCELRLAVNEVFRNRATNERVERTCYVDVNAWNQQADFCQQYLSKGSSILVEGRLSYDEWRTPQGETRSRLRVQADRIQSIGAPRTAAAPAQDGQPAASGAAPSAPAPAAVPAPSAQSDFSGESSNDDPPF